MNNSSDSLLKIVILTIVIITISLLVHVNLDMDISTFKSLFDKVGPQMLSVSVVMIGLIVFFAIIELKMTPLQDRQVQKVVNIEAFNNNDTNANNDNGFCKTHEGDRNKLQESCSGMTKDNCLATSCCVYALMDGKEQCHSGDINGPTFKRDKNGKTKNIDYYYFRNKCIGNDCK
jgi:hypothetical protein